ncbi:MAG: alanine racemase [Micromonosporaceae bacterium]|jgi:D-serine deaminase-like pyridoxal phosphate-dependent protein
MATVILDLTRLDANLHRLGRAAAARSVAVRAHVKAHRTVEVALRQVAAGAVGVAVQTAHAARRLAAAGVDDVVLAWPWPEPWRFPLFAEAAAGVPRFAVHVDRVASVVGIGAAATARGTEVGVRVDLRHTPADQVVAVARAARDTPGVRFDGVAGYRPLTTASEVRDRHDLGRRYAHEVVDAAQRIRDAGVDCPVVSVGGTATLEAALQVPGVTEVCTGAYATFDGGLAEAGVCTADDVALSVAADATDLLDGCTQPWAPEVAWLPAGPPYEDRLVPAHVCPLAATLVRRQVPVTVVRDGRVVATWQPFAAPDRP